MSSLSATTSASGEPVWELDHIANQLELVYGPLYFQIEEGGAAWKQFEMTFKRNYHRASPFEITNNKKPGDLDAEYKPLTEDEWNTWIAWTEKEFIPRNRRIAEILKNRADLIEGWAGFSESYEQSLLHMQAFESNWRNWEATHQKDKWRLAPNWPQSFEVDVRNTFVCLKQRQAALGSVLRDEEETDQTVVECRHALAERK